MNRRQSSAKTPFEEKLRSKATMDAAQEESIEAENLRAERDQEHGDELQHVTHVNRWEISD
jgi:hypothetical protein